MTFYLVYTFSELSQLIVQILQNSVSRPRRRERNFMPATMHPFTKFQLHRSIYG